MFRRDLEKQIKKTLITGMPHNLLKQRQCKILNPLQNMHAFITYKI
jgi:hypothetical protein